MRCEIQIEYFSYFFFSKFESLLTFIDRNGSIILLKRFCGGYYMRGIVLSVFIILAVGFIPYTGIPGTEEKKPVSPQHPLYGGIYRRGLEHDPVTLDPSRITDIYEVVVTQQIVEGLVQYSDNLMVVPCIAESWESSRDNLKWVFHLKKGVRFHNGREVTADDFVYTFTRILDPNVHSDAASLISRIQGASEFISGKAKTVEGLKTRGPYILEISLSELYPPFISVLAMVNFGVVPEEEINGYGDAFGHRPVGTGPFRFERWVKGKEIVLLANDAYHEGRPYLDQVVFRIFPGGTTELMFEEFEKGNLEDSLLPADARERVLNENLYQVLQRPALVIRMYMMNNTVPPLNDVRIRQALNYAIDKERITTEVGKGKLVSATGLIPEGMAGWRPDDENFSFAPAKARDLLQKAGFPGGRGLPVIDIFSSVTSKGPLAEDEAVKKCLEDVGVQSSFHYITDWAEFKQMVQSGNAPVFKFSWGADVPDPDSIISPLFHSKSPQNIAHFNNLKVDQILERAQNESNYQKRIALYAEAQDQIMADAPVILMNYLAYIRVFQPFVRNFEGNALGDQYFSLKRVWIKSR